MKPPELEAAAHVIFINNLDLCPQIAFQGWWQQHQLSSSVMTRILSPVETTAQAEPEHSLLLFSLHTHPVTEQPTTQWAWVIKAWLRDYGVGLHLLFLKFKEKPSICHVNTHCSTLYPWLLPKSGIYNRVLLCLWTSVTIPEGKQQGGSGSMMPNWGP